MGYNTISLVSPLKNPKTTVRVRLMNYLLERKGEILHFTFVGDDSYMEMVRIIMGHY